MTGEIPEELGSLHNLEQLKLSENQLSGQIPSELGGLERLALLILNQNQFTGVLPTTLGSLANLVNLLVADNMLSGELPPGLTRLTSLQILAYHNNSGLCAPIDEAFQAWLHSVGTVDGSSCASADSQEDRALLVELYHATYGDYWTKTPTG